MLRLIDNTFRQYQALKIFVRLYNQKIVASNVAPKSPTLNPNVPGLSKKCVTIPDHPVGPNAAKKAEYKNPEYFCYHVNSFAEAEVELSKFRLPVPSNKK